MFRFLAFLFFSFCTLNSFSQDYVFPIDGVEKRYSGNFGEFRSNHLHSGVDIRTNAKVGAKVVAVQSGYISRISLSPYGFGLALYVAHPNGKTSVYAHLLSIDEELQNYLNSERKRLKLNSLNVYPEAGRFKVKQGEEIARSGNSGSSAGPHLHFEIRDSRNQKPLNPYKQGAVDWQDNIAPSIYKLYYKETARTKEGLMQSRGLSTYDVVKTKSGEYQIQGGKTLWVGREGYFVISAIDRAESSGNNTFGIYSIDLEANDELIYSLRKDGFLFSQTRYCNALNYYPLQGTARSEFYQLRRPASVEREFYHKLQNDGMLLCKAGENKKICITLRDDKGNASRLRFTVRGKDDKDCLKPRATSKRIAFHSKSNTFNDNAISVTIPQSALYDNTEYDSGVFKAPDSIAEGVQILSPEYSVLNEETPLHKAMEISIKCDVKEHLRKNILIASRKKDAKFSPLSATYKNGRVEAKTTTVCKYIVVADTIAPTIELIEKDAQAMKFRLKDNFSGIAEYSAEINGKWQALDLDGEILTLRLNQAQGKRLLELKVRDGAKNWSSYKQEIDL